MADNLWVKLKKNEEPFFALAPMEEVTDTVFRQIVSACAPPDVFFTEFTSTDGLMSKGRQAVIRRLQFTPKETPIAAQVWGRNPVNYYNSAKLLSEMGFSGIDINMGCPVKKIVKNGACAALIKTPTLAKEIINATREGAGHVPISVKTRIGFNSIQTQEWIGFLLEQKLGALIVHGRTAKEMSKVPCHWDEIGNVVQLRDEISPDTVIIGNGDIKDRSHGMELANKYRVDGLMIGRGIFQNIFAFSKSKHINDLSPQEKINLYKRHVELYRDTWNGERNFAVLKKFSKVYINEFDGASELRSQLMQVNDLDGLLEVMK